VDFKNNIERLGILKWEYMTFFTIKIKSKHSICNKLNKIKDVKMKRMFISLVIIFIVNSYVLAQDYVIEWEGPAGFTSTLKDDHSFTPANFDLNNDGYPEIVLTEYDSDADNSIFKVYDPLSNYDLLFTYTSSGFSHFLGFANVTDEALNEMIIQVASDYNFYIINTSTFESYLLVSGHTWDFALLDIDNDSKTEIILSSYLVNTQIWGDGTQSSANCDLPQSKINLNQNYPNPFNPITTINYDIKKPGYVNMKVYNVKGQLVDTLVNKKVNAGKHSVVWNAKNFSSGPYFYQISVDGKNIQTKRAILLK